MQTRFKKNILEILSKQEQEEKLNEGKEAWQCLECNLKKIEIEIELPRLLKLRLDDNYRENVATKSIFELFISSLNTRTSRH